MEYKRVLVRVRQVLSIGIKVSRVMRWTHAAILQRIANPFPGFGRGGRHEAPLTGGRGTVRYPFKDVHAVPLKPADLPGGRFCNRLSIGRDDRSSPERCFRRFFT